MAGAFVFGPLADRVGRKPVLVATTVFFGLATFASAFAPDIQTLTALRFVTGLGLGGAMPAAITLTAEFCPEKRRSSLVTLMFCGFTIGSASAGLAASSIVAAFGWPGLLMLGGVLPLLLTPVLLALLPEIAALPRAPAAPSRPGSARSSPAWRPPPTSTARRSRSRREPRDRRSASSSGTASASARC